MQKTDPLIGPMTVTHGHTDTHVAMVFSRPTQQMLFTPEEAAALIDAVNDQLRNLAAHQIKNRENAK